MNLSEPEPPKRCQVCFHFVEYCSCPTDDLDRAYEELVSDAQRRIDLWVDLFGAANHPSFRKRHELVQLADPVKLPDHVNPERHPGTMEATTECENFEEWANGWLA